MEEETQMLRGKDSTVKNNVNKQVHIKEEVLT